MATTRGIIEALVDGVAELIALCALRGARPVAVAGTGAMLEQAVMRHLKRLGLENEEIGALFNLKATRSVETRLEADVSLPPSQVEELLTRIERGAPAGEAEVIDAFAREYGRSHTEDVDRRATARAAAIVEMLCRMRIVERTGPRGRTMLSLASPHDRGLAPLVWLTIHRMGPVALDLLRAQFEFGDAALADALEELSAAGVVVESERGWFTPSSAQATDGSGWEAAFFDHMEAVFGAVSRRMRKQLPPGYGGSCERYEGYGTLEIVVEGRDPEALAASLKAAFDSLPLHDRSSEPAKTLRAYIGVSLSELPRARR